MELADLSVLGIESLDHKLSRIVFFHCGVDFTKNHLILIEERQRKLEREADDDQHHGKRTHYGERHLPAGEEHCDKHTDQHDAGLHQHAHAVLQGCAERINIVGDHGKDITGLCCVIVIKGHPVDL